MSTSKSSGRRRKVAKPQNTSMYPWWAGGTPFIHMPPIGGAFRAAQWTCIRQGVTQSPKIYNTHDPDTRWFYLNQFNESSIQMLAVRCRQAEGSSIPHGFLDDAGKQSAKNTQSSKLGDGNPESRIRNSGIQNTENGIRNLHPPLERQIQ